MRKFRRAIQREEISGLKPPGYLMSVKRGHTEEEREYIKKMIHLLDREARAHKGYSVRMHCKNGFPQTFTYLKRSYTDQALRRKINRALNGAKAEVKRGTSKDAVVARIDRILANFKKETP